MRLNEYQINFIKENYFNFGAKYCSEKLNLNKSTVISCARRNGLKVSDKILKSTRFKTKKIIDIDDYLNVVKPEISYIYGLIYADGHVSFSNNKSKTPIVKHTSVKYDSEVSDRIFKNLNWRNFNYENDLSLGKNTMSVNWISSKELGEYLISQNYREKHMGTFIYNKFKPLTNHFLRGFLDGDGCITTSNNGKYKQTSIYFSSSYLQKWEFITEILKKIDVKYKIRTNTDKLGKSSQICIHDSKSIYNLCEYIYKDSENIRLERKFNKYQEFLEYKKIYQRNNKLILK
jgi:hypothetical protein